MTTKLKKTLGYFHHREQSMLLLLTKPIVELFPNCLLYLIESSIKHHLVRNIFSKPQRLEHWKNNYSLLLIHEDDRSIEESFLEMLNAIHTDIEITSLQTRPFSTFINALMEEDPETTWIHSRGNMLYGSDDFLMQLPSRKKYAQEEEEQFWFQYLSKGTGKNTVDDL